MPRNRDLGRLARLDKRHCEGYADGIHLCILRGPTELCTRLKLFKAVVALNVNSDLCQSTPPLTRLQLSAMMRPMPRRSSKPRDINKLAASIVDDATSDTQKTAPDEGKDPNAVALGRKGGLKGGKARAENLLPEQRSEIARRAARARWQKS
jgi:hypothetical protein